jgi:hypothetical protein
LAVIATIGLSPVAGLRANLPGGLDAVHLGHLHVHQDQRVVDFLACQFHSLPAVDGRVDDEAQVLQQGGGHFAVDHVVFHQQHAAALRGGADGRGGGVGRAWAADARRWPLAPSSAAP